MKKFKHIVGFGIAASAFFLLIGCTVLTLEVYSQVFNRVEGFSDSGFYTYITWNDIDQTRYSRQEVFFRSGPNRLQGFIYGATSTKGLVIISHGLGGSADAYFPMIMFFVDRGWRVFAFNNTGVAGSEGSSMRGLYQSAIDLDAALSFVKNSSAFNGLPIMLVGHSWGGFAVCAVLNFGHQVNAVVSFAGFNCGREIFREQGRLVVGGLFHTITPNVWTLERELFGNNVNLTAVNGINKAGIPVMIVQSSDDDIVFANTTSIFAHRNNITNPYVEIIFFDGEDASGHEFVFGSREQREYINWARESWETYRTEHQNACLASWAESINFDKILANELNPELMERINEFFIRAK